MKPGIQIKAGQQLNMTPQLQHAIKLLTLSSIDLAQEIQAQVETNPMLEYEEPEVSDEKSDNEKSEIDLPLDTSWQEIYPDYRAARENDEQKFDALAMRSQPMTLKDHLLWQLGFEKFSDKYLKIAEFIIDSIDEDGFLRLHEEDIKESLFNYCIQDSDIQNVLEVIQRFDPIGVASRSLNECLIIQLKCLSIDEILRQQTLEIIQEHSALIARKQFKKVAQLLKINEENFEKLLNILKTLNPCPGISFYNNEKSYIEPDVILLKQNGKWDVKINMNNMPKLKLNHVYTSLIKRADTSCDNEFMKEHLSEARWFLKSLSTRHQTLLKVSEAILTHQMAFFEEGISSMSPLTLKDIARMTDLHESTISRVTSEKYMLTPQGLYELKFFFSNPIRNDLSRVSSTSIKAEIETLIKNENPKLPLSDAKLQHELKNLGITIARRTIAKYREGMGILSSNLRRVF